jgi:hypothetical protein
VGALSEEGWGMDKVKACSHPFGRLTGACARRLQSIVLSKDMFVFPISNIAGKKSFDISGITHGVGLPKVRSSTPLKRAPATVRLFSSP